MSDEKKVKTEFGKGFVQQIVYYAIHFMNYESEIYRLHRERNIDEMRSKIMLWAHGAGDHLYELNCPESMNDDIKDMVSELKSLGIDMRCDYGREICRIENYERVRELTLKISRAIDEHLGVEVDEGEHQ